MNSFELNFSTIAGDVIIDRDYYNTKEEQCKFISFLFSCNLFITGIPNKKMFFFSVKQVFSDMDFLGWYTTGEGPDDVDIKVHKQICEINESPVFLKLNPNSRQSDVSEIRISFCDVSVSWPS